MLPATSRLPIATVQQLIAEENYFVLHAPRQVGKTTAMQALAEQLTASGNYAAVLVSAEVGDPFRHDPGAAELALLASWQLNARLQLPADLQMPPPPSAPPGQRVQAALTAWAQGIRLPLVLFIDEIDSLQDEALLSVLRQLRSGFPNRPHAFPQSLALIGLRDVRDYKVASGGSTRLNTASPFNIKAESLTLRNFNQGEVAELYHQHTEATGQGFEPEAIQLVFELTQGQPWLVNGLARQLVREIAPNPATLITLIMVEEAKEILIQRRDTHLDSLDEKLLEPRVQSIIEPMMAGLPLQNVANDDIQFVIDLGLCRMLPEGGMAIANPIYREILPRALAIAPAASLPQITPSWLTPEGRLDLDALRESFMAFWLQHGEPLLGSAPYHEIAPHLVLMAYLHRVANGGGTLEREYAIGRDRMDLCLRYGDVVLGIEIKVWRDRRPDPLGAGQEQLDGYLARLGQRLGWLVIFDRRSSVVPIEERLSSDWVATVSGRAIAVIRA
ncbi:ATP-binding protein [Leptolyngbya sp. PCC 6406]|uniref:ATP-binding protein n=1 Tax=Leptolyngbya sp. PCC 6406 TaxID=1173264 RepID=UPI0002E5F3F8|nr:ATP-binding protein [Leptolyngbya sp. PCC 6406]